MKLRNQFYAPALFISLLMTAACQKDAAISDYPRSEQTKQSDSDVPVTAKTTVVGSFTGDGVYKIISKSSTRAMDVRGSSTLDGAQIQQSAWDGGNAQRWRATKLTNGYYKITALHSGKAVTVGDAPLNDGARILQYPYTDDLNQQWEFILATESPFIVNTHYFIRNRLSGKVINVEGDAGWDGAPLIQWPGTYNNNNIWEITRLAD
ncbi:RICIN domain-containing protein [Chitinophaga varians]|uniref:RICIN domain-containing protein n=1 Tax=Chitinophaga varians TaxID=2202339 RepID=UPI00165F6787|nr:RICIN domain-containing protein [Chitinophaga varians]MBC9914438.1 RICIN domain-containing protein [Chitinophaga varians]